MLYDTKITVSRPTPRLLLAAALVFTLLASPTALGDSPRETSVVRAYRAASPSVVNIHGQKTIRSTTAGFNGSSAESFRQVNGMGTGVIVDPRGYIITNFHVIEDVADIRVTLKDGRTVSASTISHNRANDLAVIKINVSEPLPVIARTSSEDLMVGEPVLAIGNAFGYENTLTQGIISALHRDVPVNETQSYRDLIQTSAGINPGNSGGPLLNIEGKMIGINVAVRVGAQQIAFTIPVDQALETVAIMLEERNRKQVSLGVEELLAPGTQSLQIEHPLSTQLEPGDKITKVANKEVQTRFDFALAATEVRPGDSVPMQITRNGVKKEFTLVAGDPSTSNFGARTADLVWQWIGIRTEPLSSAELRRLNQRTATPNQGGLKITSLRSGSPAAHQGIEPGDILLGIHEWRTASLDDLEMIIDHPELQRAPETRFYILRSNKTLYGYMRLADRPVARR
ncbi:Putative serine protease HtrA [Roseimaritima multifibrata]|uniref:Serine protease HtrA n=2 Tax=Roseimaritima multifibrata TaxID=1930274 RepID=A0A517MJ42_9BACT|nr:Putative serine protease HtrA [Roseimaritima multifibrata]